MPTGHTIIACHECDLLVDLPEDIGKQQIICCPRCQHQILTGHENPISHVLALSCTGIILLFIANAFPFLSFEAKGQSRSITLYQASLELYSQGFYVLALLVFCFIILLPLVYLGALVVLALPIQWGIKRAPPIALGLLIDRILPWTMTEVFLLGVLVALIKIVAMADIILGVSFWAYIGFTVVFISISNTVSSHRLWRWVEHGR